MNWRLLFGLLWFLGLHSAFAEEICPATLSCNTGATCACMVPAASAYERFYNIRFNDLMRGVDVACKLESSPSVFQMDPALSSFPKGSNLQCKHCGNFPVSFELDTNHMQAPMGYMTLRLKAPPSDMPSILTVHCDAVS